MSPDNDCLVPLVSELWGHLIGGRARVVRGTVSLDRSMLLLRVTEVPAPPLSGRTVAVLERILSGQSQKEGAIDMRVALSTITALAKRGLQQIGVECVPSRTPFLLAMLVFAARDRTQLCCARVSQLHVDGARHWLVEVPSPDALLSRRLRGAERAVAALLLEGCPYSEIARQRNTSVRTVANQIAAAFTRLRVSGRAQLLASTAEMLGAMPPEELR